MFVSGVMVLSVDSMIGILFCVVVVICIGCGMFVIVVGLLWL